MWQISCVFGFYRWLTLFYIRGEQIHPRLIKLCAVSRFDVQTTSNLLTTKTNMSFICVSNFRSLKLNIHWDIDHCLEVTQKIFKFPAHFSSKLAEECKHNNGGEEEKRRSMCITLRICCLLTASPCAHQAVFQMGRKMNAMITNSSIYSF